MTIDIPFIITCFFEIVTALPLTLVITVIPLIIGFGIGVVTALMRIYKVRFLHRIADFYVSFLRGTPVVLHVLIIYFALPLLIAKLSDQFGWGIDTASIPILVFVLTAFSLTAGAYMSEIIRSGILSVNQGQVEAAYAVGMSTRQALWRIVLPQAIGIILPNLCNLFIGFLHTSTFAFTVSQMELLGKANVVASVNLKFLEAFIAAALIYWGMTIIAERITAFLEKRVTAYNRGGIA
ncbi:MULTISPECIES: amino acid ABC transporter permease [Brevibacillus]|jgi:L-cystine transport system permease protein|uniref:amino acid ABC transporter permease n=1 Tax=Brevibacillus TaxID=55080 RepID=UPI000469E672|nr:amino acid ABC transporter permease [Brevibacillus borstelensis]KKX53221.1 cysteine ABC transporter permease [Brevibacillus borstelensis cifa_chp40]MBE5394238.1 amino acid ABC transporter permease [Brevibacillus borstelensis]MCM3559102.1 amino acid ABC transporter permease [Brevibacillus borstelensis]MCM3590643.1 amino acid ABC transporter permease [Brevibacillus borstelensis]MED1852189.1 amino acid ABC transporter permease [Brevibacillus borstelensis]